MKLLKCLYCEGELEMIKNYGVNRVIKCLKCGFTNDKKDSDPEVITINKKS